MRALVVYESMFGNTREVARAVTEGLARRSDVEAVEVADAPVTIDTDIDLIVVGCPTHAHGLSNQDTRDGARKQSDRVIISGRQGVREWIASLKTVWPGVPVATFDTRFDKPRWLTGSGAVTAAKLLRRRGCLACSPPESFFVDGTTGPVHEGELDRARQWGEKLADGGRA